MTCHIFHEGDGHARETKGRIAISVVVEREREREKSQRAVKKSKWGEVHRMLDDAP